MTCGAWQHRPESTGQGSSPPPPAASVAQADSHATFRPDCQSCGRTYREGWPCEGLAAAANCDAVRRGEGAAPPVCVCWLRLYRHRPGLRTILANAGVTKPPILDWFHIAMRLQHTK